jgi:hypothetical protein
VYFRTGSRYPDRHFMPKGSRRSKDVEVYYKCPVCSWIGYVVTDRYWVSCGQCRVRFGVSGNEVPRARYRQRYCLDDEPSTE